MDESTMRELARKILPLLWGMLCTSMLCTSMLCTATNAAPLAAAVKKDRPPKTVIVGVSWSNFQEERWKRDEAAIKRVLDRFGADYISTDAQASNEKQMRDIDSLIARGAKAIIVLAWDADAILPAIERTKTQGVAIVAYDRLIQSKDVFYITFDNVEVGRIQAREILKRKPQGNYVFIKGAETDPNAALLFSGQIEVLDAAVQRGAIKIVGDQYTEGWKPENARSNMLDILKRNNNKIDAVVASNDGTAGGVVEALHSVGLKGVPVSGQDGDIAALNRIARGQQSVSVFKDPRKLGDAAGWIASQLAQGKQLSDIAGTIQWSGGSKHIPLTALLLRSTPITTENLEMVLSSRWISKAQLCSGVDPSNAPGVCQ